MDRNITPNIVMPNRDFLIGAMYGFNAARVILEGPEIQPLYK